ncbi:hypothetical protein [Acrocarpospora sp. B8E8]|uniref:hypothetical protein n=1 Tax=Acrocarpospora sp. B8E8 TaxID=3153572 RepID=UPI00325D59D6
MAVEFFDAREAFAMAVGWNGHVVAVDVTDVERLLLRDGVVGGVLAAGLIAHIPSSAA